MNETRKKKKTSRLLVRTHPLAYPPHMSSIFSTSLTRPGVVRTNLYGLGKRGVGELDKRYWLLKSRKAKLGLDQLYELRRGELVTLEWKEPGHHQGVMGKFWDRDIWGKLNWLVFCLLACFWCWNDEPDFGAGTRENGQRVAECVHKLAS